LPVGLQGDWPATEIYDTRGATVDKYTGLIIAGLTTGAIYALVAVSFNVIFSATGVLNFAQGELFMAGAMLCALLYNDRGISAPLALVITVAAVAAIAVLEERLAVRRALRAGRGAMGWVLATLGFSIVMASTFSLLFGPDIRQPRGLFSDKPQTVLGITYSNQQLSLVVVAVLVAIGLAAFYRSSTTGVAMRALAQDPEAASMRGIPVSALGAVAFAISGAVVGAAGFLSAPVVGAYPSMGFIFALQGFIAAALGGIPSIKGALVGGLLLGVIGSFGADYIGAGYRTALIFAVLIVVLVIRPAGLFGRLTARAV
jgi:branched-chain amino acid transport system permease protein